MVDPQKAKALGDVINRWRIGQGWEPFGRERQNATINVWLKLLDLEKIPVSVYGELYLRAMTFRVEQISNGREIPPFCVELLLAVWPPLKKELEQKRIDSQRILPETAESQCPRCFASGFVMVKKANGEFRMTGEKCVHRG